MGDGETLRGDAVPTLVHLPYSPWSARTRLALEAQGVPVTLRAYVPTLSEPGLRLALRRPFGLVSVPVLLREDGPPLTDSLDIVRWGAARSDRPLVTEPQLGDIVAWNAAADRWLEAGRARTTPRVMADPEAMRESVPPFLRALGPLGLWFGRDAAARILRKYGAARRTPEGWREVLAAGLAELRAALDGREWLLDSFSYADLTAAFGLSFVSPHPDAPLGPRSRVAWTEADLAAAYPDLLAWRDRVVAHARSLRGR
jgi:glutathione S-transferase